MKTKTSVLSVFIATIIVLLVNACGGGGGGGGSSDLGSGSVTVALTDKPANLADIDKILITITGVEIFAEDGDKVTLYSGRPRGPFDLLELEHESRPLAFGPDVPAGRYCKIRLTLSDLELVFNEDTGEPNFHPKLPGNNKLDLNPRECFYVAADSKVYLQLDMDAKSIHVVQTGSKKHYNFRPVVFIDVIQRDFPAKLVRLEDGVIREIDRENGTLLLCEFSYGENARGEFDDCMTVLISRETSAFDNIDNDGINDVSNGDAIPLDELMIPERVGETPVTVIGRFSSSNNDDQGYPVVDALVVELGGFLELGGTVARAASDIRFNMNVDPNQGIQVEGELPVALQPDPEGGNGTKILSRSGELLSSTDLIPSRSVMVDGVLLLSDPDYLNSSLVIVDIPDGAGNDEASGTAERVGTDSLLLAADTFPCEAGSGSFIVSFNNSTIVYLSTESGGGFVDTGSLAPGQALDISGMCEGTTLAATTIIIRE